MSQTMHLFSQIWQQCLNKRPPLFQTPAESESAPWSIQDQTSKAGVPEYLCRMRSILTGHQHYHQRFISCNRHIREVALPQASSVFQGQCALVLTTASCTGSSHADNKSEIKEVCLIGVPATVRKAHRSQMCLKSLTNAKAYQVHDRQIVTVRPDARTQALVRVTSSATLAEKLTERQQ